MQESAADFARGYFVTGKQIYGFAFVLQGLFLVTSNGQNSHMKESFTYKVGREDYFETFKLLYSIVITLIGGFIILDEAKSSPFQMRINKASSNLMVAAAILVALLISMCIFSNPFAMDQNSVQRMSFWLIGCKIIAAAAGCLLLVTKGRDVQQWLANYNFFSNPFT